MSVASFSLMQLQGWVYILTNKNHTVFYAGVTNNPKMRVKQHRDKIDPMCFTARYNVNKLVYYVGFPYLLEAIQFEKKIKGKGRAYKVALINKRNPAWKDLFDDL